MRTPKFSPRDVAYIKTLLDQGDSLRDIAEICHTSYQTILKIKKGTYVANETRGTDALNMEEVSPDPANSRSGVGQTQPLPLN